MSKRPLATLIRATATWMAPIAIGAGVAEPIARGERAVWNGLREALGLPLAALAVGLALLGVSLAAAALFGALPVPGRMALYRVFYGIRMAPFWAREFMARRYPGNRRRTIRYPTLEEFEEEDDRRTGDPQIDYGVHWRDRGQRSGHRLTWIEPTGELVAVAGGRAGEGGVEVIAVIRDKRDVDRRLEHWSYAAFGRASLAWVRRRAHGWRVPLAPSAQSWLVEDSQPPIPWPSPPPPTVGKEVGAYLGRKGSVDNIVQIVDVEEQRPLYHYVDSSPTGFAWGYHGAGPTDLAASLLANRLGYMPQSPIIVRFRNDVVSRLAEEFLLTFEEVDRWIDKHRQLFARYPRAVPFDPYAAGGAY